MKQEDDLAVGDLVKFSSTASVSAAEEKDGSVLLVVEKRLGMPWKIGHPFYYVYTSSGNRIGPCYHHELLKINE